MKRVINVMLKCMIVYTAFAICFGVNPVSEAMKRVINATLQHMIVYTALAICFDGNPASTALKRVINVTLQRMIASISSLSGSCTLQRTRWHSTALTGSRTL